MSELVDRLRRLNDGVSRPVSIIEREICGAAADFIERSEMAMKEACDLLSERKYGSPARSPGHNARLHLESALVSIQNRGQP